MDGTFTIGGPETIAILGVQVKTLSAAFGVLGVVLGHLMAPASPVPLGWRRQSAVIAAGLLMAIAIAITTGQRPLMVLGWSIGIGFAGIAIYQLLAAHATAATRTIGSAALEELSQRLAALKDKP